MEEVEKSLILDPYMIKVIGWLLLFLFTSLVGIIVWLAKGVFTKLETVSNKQDINQNHLSLIENNLSTLRDDTDEIFKKLEDIPNLSTKTTLIESTLNTMQLDMSIFKKEHLDMNKRLSEVEKSSALHEQWIKLKGTG